MSEIKIAEFTRFDVARTTTAAVNSNLPRDLFGVDGFPGIDAIVCGTFLAADRVLDGRVLFEWARQNRLHTIRSYDDLTDAEQFGFEVFARVYLALLPMAERSERQVQDAARDAEAARRADAGKPLLRRAIERIRGKKAARAAAALPPPPAKPPRAAGGRFAPRKPK